MKKVGVALLLLQFVAHFSVAQEDKYGKTPDECKKYVSLYREFRDQKNIKDAFEPWKKAVELCPKAAKTLYTDGVKFLKYKISKEKNDSIKSELIEDLWRVYDMRIQHFGQEGYVLGRQGNDMLRYRSDDPTIALKVLKESVKLRGKNSEAGALGGYYTALYYAHKKDTVSKEELMTEYIRISDFISHNIATKDSAKVKYYHDAQNTVDKAFASVAECADIIPIFEEKIKTEGENLAVLKMAEKILSARNCEDSEVYEVVATELHKLEPSHTSAFGLGRMMRKKGKNGEAIDYFKQALDSCKTCENKEAYTLGLADAFLANGQYHTAANTARDVLKINPKNGSAYLVIGNAISASSKSCSGNELQKRSVYWLAADYFNKAKAVDPTDSTIVKMAQQRYNGVKALFPDKKLTFQFGVQKSAPFEVECWGKEKTTVRIID